MLEPLLRWNDFHATTVYRNKHQSSQYKRSSCPYHETWRSALEPIVRFTGAPVCCTSIHGAKDDSPVAFANRLRICRLMYKPLPHGSCKLDPRHYRIRRLALIKKRAIKQTQTFAARRAIPQYFQKRIKHKLLAKHSALPGNCSTESAPTIREPSVANEGNVSNDSSPDTQEVELSDPSIPPTEADTATRETHIDTDSLDCKDLTVASPKRSALDRVDALKTFKEYYSIQCAIRLLLSMLQERMEEVETMQKIIIPTSKEDMVDKMEDVDSETNNGLTENDLNVKEALVKIEPNQTPEHNIIKDFDPNKENNVPLISTVESMSPVTVALNRANSTPSKEEPKEDTKPYSFLEASKSDILDPSYTCDIELEPLESRKNRSIVDSLLNKFNLSPPVKAAVPSPFFDHCMDAIDGRRSLRDRTKIAARPRYSEIPEEPRKMRVSKVFGKLHKTLNIDLDCTNSDSSTEFYGFDEGEVVKLDKPSLPGLLPTPIVKKSQPFAPFLTYGSSIEAEQAKSENETRSDLFREEGLISFGSVPPRLECPQRPNDMVRPRTVAQKRILVQRENDIRYVMIDNESKIFHFLKKRSRNIDVALDFCRMKELQEQQIPFTHSTWRALAWLRTEKGHYYFQTMNIDNRTIRLSGCRGNHKLKSLSRNSLYSSPVIASRGHRYHYVSNCHCPPHPEGIILNISQNNTTQQKNDQSEQRLLPYDNSKYLYRGSSTNNGYQSKRSYPGTKPGPLSSKCLQPYPDEDPCLGPLEVFKMPKVELEVFPKINRPLDGYVKPYLKMILPHDDITENWARFAVSTLTTTKEETEDHKMFTDESEERSFVFELPYANDQRRMLIRRRLLACPGAPMNVDVARFTKLMDEKLTFRKVIDEALARGEQDQIDPDELVCADMLSAITDSVAIALAEDVFVKDDPDIEYVKKKDDFRAYHEQMSIPIKNDTSDHGTSNNPSPLVPAPNDVGSDADTIAAVNGAGPECSKTTDPAKAKLLREMKRLNATIIEGPSEPTLSPSEPGRQQRCDPLYCSKGCICDVLSSSHSESVANIHRKQHCGQIDCVFGCTCGFTETSSTTHQAKVDHGEDDEGETALSRAEQRYLREKATARLAKEEREFTPTVILTKNTTVLVQNKESECRRLKKKPKKYDDYYNDQSVQCLLNGGSVKDVSGYISKPPPNAKPLTENERMRHAHVLLNRLPQLADIEPLCMVHDLYRCFCGGKATQGKPFSFTEDNCIAIASKSSRYDGSSANGTSIEVTPSGRMTKGGSQTSAKSRTKDQEAVEPSIDTTNSLSSLVNVRKRLYSFEKPQGDPNDGKVQKTYQGSSHRKRRDSSEESYKPPNERKVARKNSKTSTNDTSSGAIGGIIRARRASVAPGHIYARQESTLRRPSMATQPATVVNKQHSLAMRRASVASPHLLLQKEYLQKSVKTAGNVSSRRSEAPDNNIADNSLYTIIKPTKAQGSSKINNLILKRVTSQTSEPTIAPNLSKSSSPSTTATLTTLLNKTTPPLKTQANKSNVPVFPAQTKRMSVRELKQLMMRECKSSIAEEKDTPVASNSKMMRPVVNILLVDSEENIDNEPRLNILSEGTKKLVISGKRRSFVENTEFKNGFPPARTLQPGYRTVYVVQMATEDAVPEAKSKQSQSSVIKKSNYNTLQQNTDSEVYSSSTFKDDPSEEQLKQWSIVAKKSQPAQTLEGGTIVEKTDRLLCSLMHHINELLRRDNLDISPGKKGILHICRWKQLLSSFALGEVDVLDLTLTNGTEMTIITKTPSEQHLMTNVKYRLSARRLTIDKMIDSEQPSLLMKMIVCQVDNVKMNNLALVLYGNQNFWHFCGFLKANEKSFMSDSNVLTKPSKLASGKIKMRLKEYYQKTTSDKNQTVGTSARGDSSSLPHTVTSHKQQSNKQTPSTVSLSTQSNIEILRKGLQQVHFPLGLLPGLPGNPNGDCCRWMRLKIENDFSHMYLQSWQCCITYGTIKKAIYDANRHAKPICLETPVPRDQLKTQLLPYVYALPKEGHALFLGPYNITETKIDVILCQSVKDSLYEREVYERLHGISTNSNTKRTSGWWVDAVTSRVASVDMRNILSKYQKTTAEPKKTSVPVAPTTQRSLLKRNNISSAVTTGTPNETTINDKSAEKKRRDEAKSQDDSDSDDVVVLESSLNENITILSAKDMVGQESTIENGQPPRKEFSVEHNAEELLKLVQGTMRQNQQQKREIAMSLELQRASTTTAQTPLAVGRDEQNRKRSSTGRSPAVDFTLPSKVPRRSDPFIESASASHQQQQLYPSPSGTRITPSSTTQSNASRRLSLSGPQLMKTASNVSRHSGTVSITPLKSPETTAQVIIQAQNSARSSHTLNRQVSTERRMTPNDTIQTNSFRRLSLSDPRSLKIGSSIVRNSGSVTITSIKSPEASVPSKMAQNATRPSHISNSQGPATRAPIPRSRLNSVAVERFNGSPPTMLEVDEQEDDVVLLDDDDDDEVMDSGTGKTPVAAEMVPRLVKNKSTDVLNGIGNQAAGQKTLLSKEQLKVLSSKLDLKKTGQQDGYNYNRAEGVLKITRSLLNSLQRDEVLKQSDELPSNENVTVASNSRSINAASAVAATPSTTITMPRMKVVPRVSVTPGSANKFSDSRTDTSKAAQSGGSGTNLAINLKYLNEEQKDKKILLQPHTRGVLESKIPGLGLVEAVRFNNQEVIINLKELTIKKQLVSVPNLEAAVTLLNQFIHRNTYAFKPLNLVIKWQFKERITPVKPEEKLTSIISQCCLVTPYGLVNLFKTDQIEMIRLNAPSAMYEDVLKMKLSMLCLDKKSYDEERCHEYEDKIYERAFETIKSLEKKRHYLLRQVGHLGNLVKTNETRLRDLKEVSSSVEANRASSGRSQESVIVIDDDE